MYDLIKLIPRYPKTISYSELEIAFNNDSSILADLLCEAQSADYEYINSHQPLIVNGSFSLTEKGQATIESYKQDQRNQKIMEQSLSAAKWALGAAAISAVASIIAILINIF